jgi:hypothetical protein
MMAFHAGHRIHHTIRAPALTVVNAVIVCSLPLVLTPVADSKHNCRSQLGTQKKLILPFPG